MMSSRDELLQLHDVTAQWVRGHVGHVENERCDELADAAAARIALTPAPPPPAPQGQTVGGFFIATASAEEERE